MCDNSFDIDDADVICKQVGFATAVSAKRGAHYGEPSGHVWKIDVRCNGHETTLSDCQYGGVGNEFCLQEQYAAVTCAGLYTFHVVDALYREWDGGGVLKRKH